MNQDSCGSPNPCQADGDTSASCNDLPPPQNGFTCTCSSGYVASGTSCVPENGCAPNDPCDDFGDSGATCVDSSPPETGNTCTCSAGYESSTTNHVTTCINIDECNPTNPCNGIDSDAVCFDKPAPEIGYSCTCSFGFEFDGTQCVNIDACAASPCAGDGDVNATCTDILPADIQGFITHHCNCSDGYRSVFNETMCEEIVVSISAEDPAINFNDGSGYALVAAACGVLIACVVFFFVYRHRIKKKTKQCDAALERAETELRNVHASHEFDTVEMSGVMCDIPLPSADEGDLSSLKKRAEALEAENRALRDDNSKHKQRIEKHELNASSHQRFSVARKTDEGFGLDSPDIDL